MEEPIVIKNVNLIDTNGFNIKRAPPVSYFWSALRVIVRLFFLIICVSVCGSLFWLEANIVAKTTPIYLLEEVRTVEEEEAGIQLKNFTLLLWTFAVYTLITEMMHILALNEKIRILEALRHRSKMESIISLIRQKSYFDADAVDFILRNRNNNLVETVNDEMEAEVMVHHRVHGMDPHRKFDNGKD